MGRFLLTLPTTPFRQAMTLLKNGDDSFDDSFDTYLAGSISGANAAGPLPFPKGSGKTIAVIGQAVNNTGMLTGNYDGPLCPKGGTSCWPTVYEWIAKLHSSAPGGGKVVGTTDVRDPAKAVAAATEADFVVLMVDNAKDGGGEGHDRYTVGLSADQLATCEAVLALGKPTVLVLVNGGAISIDALKEKAPAILEAYMPGVHGPQAIAETIFGDNNPGGATCV